MKTKLLQIFIMYLYIFFMFNCGSLFFAISDGSEKEKINLLSFLVPLALKGGNNENESNSSDGLVTAPTPIETTTPSLITKISPITQNYIDSIKAGKYEIKQSEETSSFISLFYKTIGDFLKIGEDQRVVLKAKEVKFISISGKTTTIHMNYNSIDLLMGKIGLSTILNKKMIPQGTYSKAIIVLENPKGVVENEGNQFNLDIPNSNELVIEFTHPIEFVNGLTTEITFNFDLKSLKENPGKDFTLDVNLQYQSSEINLPFQPGILISSLKKEINIITDKDGL